MPPETLDSLDKDALKPLLIELLAQNKALNERIGALLDQNKALLARIAELEAKLGKPPKTPDNSSPTHAATAATGGPDRPRWRR